MGVTNHTQTTISSLEMLWMSGSHTWYPYQGENPRSRQVKGPKGETTANILPSRYNVQIVPNKLYLYP